MVATEPGAVAKPTVFGPKNWANKDSRTHAGHRHYMLHHRHHKTGPLCVTAASRNWMSLLLPPSVTRMELGQPLLPPIAGYAYTLAARRLGLEYLTFQFYLWKGALFHKIGDFPDVSMLTGQKET